MQNISAFILFICLSISNIFLLPTTTYAKEQNPHKEKDIKKWSPFVDLNLKIGNTRSLGRLDFFLPVFQNKKSILFLDYRTMLDDHENEEINLGLGFRKINNKTWILGGYGFVDRKNTENDNYFTQGVIGLETLTTHWDFRANWYNPLSDDDKIVSMSTLTSVSTTIQITDVVEKEKAMRGYDLEIGRSIPNLDNFRLFVAYYSFFAEGVEDFDGFRFRADYKLNRYIKFEFETQDDDVKGNVNYAGLKLTFPFGSKEKYNNLTNLEKRMVTPIVRDIDIVTNELNIPTTGTVTSADGNIQHIIYVDNSNVNPGDGTKENPYNTLATAESASSIYDIIYIYEGDGTSTNMNNGFILKQGQKLWGEATDLIVDYNGRRVNVLSGDINNRPVITDLAGHIITLNNNNEIAGLQIENGPNSGIYGTNITGFNIHDNILTDNGSVGINITENGGAINYSGTISNNTINDVNDESGIYLLTNSSSTLDITITNNSIENNNDTINGISFEINGDSELEAIINNCTISNGNEGISIITGSNSNSDITINNSTLIIGNKDGVSYRTSDNSFLELSLNNNIIRNNKDTGILGTVEGFSSNTLNMSNNTLISNALNLTVTENAYLDANITGNDIHYPIDAENIYIERNDSSTADITISNNDLIRSNLVDGHGISLFSDSLGGVTNATITKNNISFAYSGIFLDNFTGTSYGTIDLGNNVDKDYLLNTDPGTVPGTTDEMGNNVGSYNIYNLELQ